MVRKLLNYYYTYYYCNYYTSKLTTLKAISLENPRSIHCNNEKGNCNCNCKKEQQGCKGLLPVIHCCIVFMNCIKCKHAEVHNSAWSLRNVAVQEIIVHVEININIFKWINSFKYPFKVPLNFHFLPYTTYFWSWKHIPSASI